MAKIKYSALVSDMRNKLNGSVLSKNRYGSYVRNKVTPVNPDTTYQQRARSAFGTLSSGWAGLTNAQRESFAQLATRHPFTDIFGDSKHLDGKSMYIKVNGLLVQLGKPSIETAQPFISLPELAGTSFDYSDEGGQIPRFLISGMGASVPENLEVVVYATPALPPEINYVKNRLRLMGSYPVVVGGVNFDDAWEARFGASYPEGNRVHARWAFLDKESGQLSVPVSGVVTITEEEE